MIQAKTKYQVNEFKDENTMINKATHGKNEQPLDQIITKITKLYSKLEMLYEQLDELGICDTSTLRILLKYQCNLFDPEYPQF
jgi:hypothetical protein